MENKIAVLHLSDMHLNEKNSNKCYDLVVKLLQDVKKLETENDFHVSKILFTGDLVDTGTNNNFELAKTNVITPLLVGLKLKNNDFLLVPGNHEVDVKKISTLMEDSLESTLKKIDAVEAFTKTDYEEYFCHRLHSFFILFGFLSSNSNDDHWLINTEIMEHTNKKIGITLVNTAWKSRGDSNLDKSNIIVPTKFLDDALDSIKACDLKICMMHHPMRWFREDQKDMIEQYFGRYDIVISGHTHSDYSINQIGPNNRTFFSTANKLMPLSGENGYFIYIIDLLDFTCRIISRQYYPNRATYDKKIDKAQDGSWTIQLKNNDPISETTYRIKTGIQKRFFDFGDTLFLSYKLSEDLEHRITPFIFPKLIVKDFPVDKNKPTKKVAKSKVFKWNQIFDDNKAIKIFGSKESGKTVLCHYLARHFFDNFLEYRKIPIVIDYTNILGKGDYKDIFWECKKFIETHAADTLKISTEDIETILTNDRAILILDNFKDKPEDIAIIDSFLIKYPLKKIIMVVPSIILLTSNLIRERYKTDFVKYQYLDLQPFTKNQIRELSKSILRQDSVDYDKLCDRVVACFNFASLPRNPFALTLFLSVCQSDANFEPINVSTMIERYVELLLQKLSKEDIKAKSFDYKSKSTFLASVAKKMYDENRYYLSKAEFQEFLNNYHNKQKFLVSDTMFDQIFFDQGVLMYDEEIVYFRFKCLNMYFLAVYGVNNPELATTIADSPHYYNYSDFFNYYSGLKRNDIKLLNKILAKVTQKMQYEENGNDLLSIESIKIDLGIKPDYEQEILKTEPLPEDIRDAQSDIKSEPDFNPEDLDYTRDLDDEDVMYLTVEILGHLIKNSEEIDGQSRSEALNKYLKGSMKILEYLVKVCHQIFEEKKLELGLDEKNEGIQNQKEIQNRVDEVKGMIRIVVPMALQMWVRENVGTGKLYQILLEKIDNPQQFNKYELFSLVMLFCDLRLSGWNKVLSRFILKCTSRDLLTITYYKCRYYLFYNYYPKELNEIQGVMITITEKVMNVTKAEAQKEVESMVSSIKLPLEG